MSGAEREALIGRVYGYVTYRIGAGAAAEAATREALLALAPPGDLDPAAERTLPRALAAARAVLAAAEPQPTSPESDLDRALAELHERDRELVALRCGAGLEAAEIAALLGLREETVRTALARTLGKLFERLGPDFPGISE